MKTEFEFTGPYYWKATIIGKNKFNPTTFVKISTPLKSDLVIHGKKLETFAVNILKALKSKRLKQ